MARRLRMIIDGDNLFWIAMHAAEGEATSTGRLVGGLRLTLNRVAELLAQYAPDELIVCWDSPPYWRREIFPDYKAGRKKRRDERVGDPWWDSANEQKQDVIRGLSSLGVPCVSEATYEADDLIAALIPTDGHSTFRALIVSTDKDLLQLCRWGLVDVVTPFDDRHWKQDRHDGSLFEVGREVLAASPKHFLWERVLIGDPADSIPGVKGVGKKRAAEAIMFGRLESTLFKHLLKQADLPSDKARPWFTRIVSDSSLINRNLKLMELPCPTRPRLNTLLANVQIVSPAFLDGKCGVNKARVFFCKRGFPWAYRRGGVERFVSRFEKLHMRAGRVEVANV